jgi:hypothetical protein
MHANKEKLRVEIHTASHRIIGDLHIFAGARLTDIMQSRETQTFFALTDVEAYNLNTGELLFRSQFIDVNRSHIVFIRPFEQSAARGEERRPTF